MADTKKELGSRLRAKRIDASLSQAEVANKLGVSQVLISHWETGRRNPDPNQLDKLTSLLGPLNIDQDSAVSSEVSPFGAWLRSVRAKLELTPAQVAQQAGVSIPTIYNLESGRIDNPQKATIAKITNALGQEPSEETVKATQMAAEIEGVGNLEDFDPHDIANFPTGAGVYVFYDISQRPIYVGESNDLKRRLRDYNDKFWFKRPIVESASFIAISDGKLRQQVEKILIRFLKSNAVLNKHHVDR
jgi:transcriptional regulator with XRE-family HTH domain